MNDLVKLSEIFDVIYGVNLELVHIEQCTSTTENRHYHDRNCKDVEI